MANFFSWLVNKLRFRRFALSGNIKELTYGAFYYGNYSNWKHDPTPLIFVMHSDSGYTHGINTHYMSRPDKEWFGRMIYLLKKGGQVIDGLRMYRLLKLRRKSIIDTCYRVYFTNLLDMKMVGAGLTDLDRLVYPITKDPWLLALNEMLKPSDMTSESGIQIAYDPQELQTRIDQVLNSQPIQQQSVRSRAPYQGGAPYQSPAPWIKPS